MRRIALLLLLAAGAVAVPRGELVREEAFNYRIVGDLPAGWRADPAGIGFTYLLEGIPHAHVRLVRERVAGLVDVAAQVEARRVSYRFPGVEGAPTERVSATLWGGHDAVLYEHETILHRIACRRRVTALYVRPVWYELIETVYGDADATEDTCRAGLELFRNGFLLLTEPLPEGAGTEAEAGTLASRIYGYELAKPQGYVRTEADPARDTGCREVLERVGPGPRQHVWIRLFEFGLHDDFDPPRWMDGFFASFATAHEDAKRSEASAPFVEGARRLLAERFSGRREGVDVEALVVLAEAPSGRVFALRVRSQAGAPKPETLQLRLE